MDHPLTRFLLSIALTALVLGSLAAWLTLVPRLGTTGRSVADRFAKAPLLDLVVATFTWLPWVACGIAFGWLGMLGSIVGQAIVLAGWCFAHEMMHREAAKGPRIVKFINRTVGRGRNHIALWVTLIALPAFWFIRIAEFAIYWTLPALLGFPKYKQSEWINVSRQKFEGLVGHDLIWCLYCDWMTGVYSLGAEMLRNVESFWCPIRFYDGKKCDNCKTDFPDITGGWVPATGTMTDVVATMEKQYGDGNRSWFGHRTRLTVKGKPVE
ncbi:MAG TPA: hypothetical protein VGN72_06390 [Tepidisphaeraceae bacterium]|jgi:hypothetical protein|nr:hypothetical protein [Tepidisphaeraceae bacterium]